MKKFLLRFSQFELGLKVKFAQENTVECRYDFSMKRFCSCIKTQVPNVSLPRFYRSLHFLAFFFSLLAEPWANPQASQTIGGLFRYPFFLLHLKARWGRTWPLQAQPILFPRRFLKAEIFCGFSFSTLTFFQIFLHLRSA